MSLAEIDGVLINPWIPVKTFRRAVSYVPKEGDLFVASYPKCGTTWMQYIVHEILNDCCEPPFIHEMMWEYGRHMEYAPFEVKNASDGVNRHLKTHLSFKYVPYNESAKYIYIFRNPWDVCVSGYNFKIQYPEDIKFNGTFADFFSDFINGHIDYGSYFDHIVSWLKERGKENILFVSYEETKQDTKATVLKVAKFLGTQYFTALNTNEEKMAKLLHYVSFDYMKNLPFVLPNSRDVLLQKGINVGKNVAATETGDYINLNLVKEGKVGYTKQWFSDQQKAVMKEMIRKYFSEFSQVLNVWKQHNVDV